MTSDRGQGLRSSEGADRDLSWRRIFDQHAAQGEARKSPPATRSPRRWVRNHPADRQTPARSVTARFFSCSISHRPPAFVPAKPGETALLRGDRDLGPYFFFAPLPPSLSAPSPPPPPPLRWLQNRRWLRPLSPIRGNNAWMMTATLLVLLMILPGPVRCSNGGGLTRSKNMLSTMTQIAGYRLPRHAGLGDVGLQPRFLGDTTYEGTLGPVYQRGAATSCPAPMPAARRRPSPMKSSANMSSSASR